jgi:hypothetical protein
MKDDVIGILVSLLIGLLVGLAVYAAFDMQLEKQERREAAQFPEYRWREPWEVTHE